MDQTQDSDCFTKHLIVDFSYEIVNGLSGMQRDIVLRLCCLCWFEDDKIRSIFGMCGKYYQWKRHRFFVNNRPLEIVDLFHENSKEQYILGMTISGIQCRFTPYSLATIFLNTTITQGVFRWTVKPGYNPHLRKSDFYLGAAPADLLRRCECMGLGTLNGSASFFFWRRLNHLENTLRSLLWGIRWGPHGYEASHQLETPVPDNSLVSIEADSAARTLCFFVNGQKVPRAVSDMCFPLHFGMSGSCNVFFISLSFRRLPSVTPSPVVCKFYPCLPRLASL